MDELKSCVGKLKQGDPLKDSTTQSAVINQRPLDSILDKMQDAQEKGATIICGGKVAEEKGRL